MQTTISFVDSITFMYKEKQVLENVEWLTVNSTNSPTRRWPKLNYYFSLHRNVKHCNQRVCQFIKIGITCT